MALREYIFRGVGSIVGVVCLTISFRMSQLGSLAPVFHLVFFFVAMACFVAALTGDRDTARRSRENEGIWRKCVLPFYIGIGCVSALAVFVFTSSQLPLGSRVEYVNPVRAFAIESVLKHPMKPLDAREYLIQVDVHE